MGTTAADALAEHLRDQVAALAAAEADVVAGGAEGVHDARVATRRLRAVLTEFPRLVPRNKTADLRERLSSWGRLLGDARDLEVQLGTLDELAAGPARERARAEVGPRLEAARQAAVGHLGTAEHTRLHADLDALAARPPFTSKADRPWDEELPRGARRAARRVARRSRDAVGAEGPELDEALHGVRKAARRARYAAEVVARGSGDVARDAEEAAERYERVQDTLGLQHDAVVLRGVLADLSATAEAAGEDPAPYDELSAVLTTRTAAALTALTLVTTLG